MVGPERGGPKKGWCKQAGWSGGATGVERASPCGYFAGPMSSPSLLSRISGSASDKRGGVTLDGLLRERHRLSVEDSRTMSGACGVTPGRPDYKPDSAVGAESGFGRFWRIWRAFGGRLVAIQSQKMTSKPTGQKSGRRDFCPRSLHVGFVRGGRVGLPTRHLYGVLPRAPGSSDLGSGSMPARVARRAVRVDQSA